MCAFRVSLPCPVPKYYRRELLGESAPSPRRDTLWFKSFSASNRHLQALYGASRRSQLSRGQETVLRDDPCTRYRCMATVAPGNTKLSSCFPRAKTDTRQERCGAAFRMTWSDGMVEGHILRLKLLKRQMYGRASFDLLRLRVLNPACDRGSKREHKLTYSLHQK